MGRQLRFFVAAALCVGFAQLSFMSAGECMCSERLRGARLRNMKRVPARSTTVRLAGLTFSALLESLLAACYAMECITRPQQLPQYTQSGFLSVSTL
jgi:hypothetical protein